MSAWYYFIPSIFVSHEESPVAGAIQVLDCRAVLIYASHAGAQVKTIAPILGFKGEGLFQRCVYALDLFRIDIHIKRLGHIHPPEF